MICDLHGLSWAGSVHCMQHFAADSWLSSHLCLGISVFPASPSQVHSVPSESFLRALPTLAQTCAVFSGLHFKPGSKASSISQSLTRCRLEKQVLCGWCQGLPSGEGVVRSSYTAAEVPLPPPQCQATGQEEKNPVEITS